MDYLEVWHDAFGPDNGENVPATELWKSLLDKGYHLPITYGRDWHRQSDRHFGVTYLNMEEPTAACALEAIRAGRTVVSFGAKFFFRVHRWGETYGIGDTLKRGRVIFSFLRICTPGVRTRATSRSATTPFALLRAATSVCWRRRSPSATPG